MFGVCESALMVFLWCLSRFVSGAGALAGCVGACSGMGGRASAGFVGAGAFR